MRRASQRDGRKDRRGPEERTWAPGYYYVLFEDPDGIRLEVNYVPGVGLLRRAVVCIGKWAELRPCQPDATPASSSPGWARTLTKINASLGRSVHNTTSG
jgi:hypothetical protein